GRVVPDLAGQPGGAHPGVVGVPLDLAGGPGERGEPAVRPDDRVPRVLPALVDQAGVGVARVVVEVPVVVGVAVLLDPPQCGAGLRFQLAYGVHVAGPPLVLVEHHEEQRGRVAGTV